MTTRGEAVRRSRGSRPRIRTVKPETWQDEKVGRLSRDARLLFIGLITLADDEGRFRALPSIIVGHVFPYDGDAAKKLGGWMGELADGGMIARYERDGMPYGVIPNWKNHQKINRASESVLPDPSLNGHGSITERSVRKS